MLVNNGLSFFRYAVFAVYFDQLHVFMQVTVVLCTQCFTVAS